MFDDFLQSYDVFQKSGAENPLLETLRLFDLLSNGALRKMDLSALRHKKMDLHRLAQKRKEGMPLEYIVEMATFMGLTLSCSPDTLIPREETELLANVALDFIKKRHESEDDVTVIDVGTGCGNIAVSLAMNSDKAKILASDICPAAVEIARKNVAKHDLHDRVLLFCGDLLSPFHGSEYEGRIDLVVCNPPYIPTGSLSKLPPEIIDHEPRLALDAGSYGIDFYRRLIVDSFSILKPKGVLVFEIGVGQEELVTRLLQKRKGYEDIDYFDDGTHIRVISTVKRSDAKLN